MLHNVTLNGINARLPLIKHPPFLFTKQAMDKRCYMYQFVIKYTRFYFLPPLRAPWPNWHQAPASSHHRMRIKSWIKFYLGDTADERSRSHL